MLKIFGRISVCAEVESFVSAGEYQKFLEEILCTIRERYPDATLEFGQKRARRPLDLRREPTSVVSLQRARAI